MKKFVLRLVSVFLCITAIVLTLVSCNAKYVELGPYKLKEKEYVYMLGMYKRNLLNSLNVTEDQLSQQLSSGITLGEYMDNMYMTEFRDTVFSLVYSQSLFDDYGLELLGSEEEAIKNTVESIATYFELATGESFNNLAKEYGFNKRTLISVYTMQKKELMVLEHLYGKNYENVSQEDKEAYFKDIYFHFQVMVINNTYKEVEGSDGKKSYVALSNEEKEEKNKIISELTALLIDNKTPYNGEGEAPEGFYKYEIINPEDSYEMLWAKYSDDKVYPNGYYMQIPTAYQLQSVNTYTTAYLLQENDCGQADFKMSLSPEDAASVGLSGENPTCGKTFVKKLSMDGTPYEDEAYKDFFGEKSEFYSNAAIYAYGKLLQEYQDNNMFKDDFKVNNDLYNISFADVKANGLDYYFLYNKSEQ